MNFQRDGVDVIFEEDPWCATTVFNLLHVVSNRVLVGMEGLGARSYIGGRNHCEEVLECNECLVGLLEGIIEWLRDVREVSPEGKLANDMRHVNICTHVRNRTQQKMINVLSWSVWPFPWAS